MNIICKSIGDETVIFIGDTEVYRRVGCQFRFCTGVSIHNIEESVIAEVMKIARQDIDDAILGMVK